MRIPLLRRVLALEQQGGRWRYFEGRPVNEWPDEALLGLLSATGAWRPGKAEGEQEPTDETLRRIAADGQ